MVNSNTTMVLAMLVGLILTGLSALEAQSPMGAQMMSSGTQTTTPPTAAPDCLTALANISDCLTYVQVGSNLTKPDKACCPEFAGLLESNPICLCSLVGQSDQYGVDLNRALMLPDACKVEIPSLDSCPAAPVSASTPSIAIEAPGSTKGSSDLNAQPQNSSESPSSPPNLSKSPFDPIAKDKGGSKSRIILLVVVPGFLFIGLCIIFLWYAWAKKSNTGPMVNGKPIDASERQEAIELPLFSFSSIANATSSFSPDSKIGEGGFGPVYKGVLEEGLEIAVKRLSKTSSQGTDEFKNEVICISKLQHRNLVKLLGCCIERDEKLLIYEYMPNGSLDSFIFDKTQGMLLNWTKRFDIIKGISRGLVYLHQDSRLRIIHRDLKAGNILLDLDMNPKISDFGLARSFCGNETQANTERVVGTYGYMSPEYALDGLFSIKSDVFSFGVLVLEIVSGKRNRGFIHPETGNNLIGHAWTLYNNGRSMELIDASLVESCYPPEVLRSIEVGLLCVQQNAVDRPDMSFVIQMLGGERAMPQPKQPAFFMEKDLLVAAFSSNTDPGDSINKSTITEVEGR